MISPIPWPTLKTPLLILLAVLLLTGTGVWWSANMLQQVEAARTQQVQASNAAKQKLERSNTEKQLIGQYLGAYRTLIARGFIGPENRLAWLEAVQQANRDAQLYGLDYSMEPRTLAPASSTTVPLGQTVMRVRMPILVEDDLMHFLDALQQRTQSVFRVRACQISRPLDSAPQALNRPELEAECELLWFTIADIGAPRS